MARKKWRVLLHMQMIEFHESSFAWFLYSFGPLSRVLAAYHLGRGEMSLHDAVGVNCGKCATTENKGSRCRVYGVRGCTLNNCECVI